MKWPAGEVAALIDGFYVLQRLRMQHQASRMNALLKRGDLSASTSSGEDDQENRVEPESLHSLDRQLLREALRMAKSVQFRLRQQLHLGQ